MLNSTPHKYSILIILSAVLNILISCTPESCQEETQALVKATFYKDGTNKIYVPDSLTIFGLGMEENKLYNKALNISTIQLPLNASVDSCGYVVKINVKTDTIIFRYSSYPHMISKECGLTFFHVLDSSFQVTGTAVKKIELRNRNITTINEENIRIFY